MTQQQDHSCTEPFPHSIYQHLHATVSETGTQSPLTSLHNLHQQDSFTFDTGDTLLENGSYRILATAHLTDGKVRGGYAEFRVGASLVTHEQLHEDPVINAILQRLRLPVEGDGWRFHNESPSTHIGKDENAIDINNGAGDADRGMAVLSSYAGEVVYVDKDGYGFVVLEHSADLTINGQTQKVTWWTGYMHMENITVEVSPDPAHPTVVDVGQNIGDVGKVGVDGSTSHLHYVIYVGPRFTNVDVHSVDLYQWATTNGLKYGT